MNKLPKPCLEQFTPCWCETRPNNPHCKDALPINSFDFIIIFMIFGMILAFRKIMTNSKTL